ncbi:MAG: hypothetical protein HYX76_06040 [Acidobacteria bacterium]|nr:hypothetical protein [Acidobacteriota bacterium]
MTLQEFTATVLKTRGALAETDGANLHVVLPPELASRVGLREYQHLVFDPQTDSATAATEAIRIDHDSPLVETLGALLDPATRLAFVDAPFPRLKPIDPVQELERGITVRNGVVRLRECVSVQTIYFCFVMEYEALADERRGGLLELWINPDAGSVADWPAVLEAAEPRDASLVPDLGPRLQAAAIVASRAAAGLVRHRLQDFLTSLERRRTGDLRRLREYFDGIHQEIRRKVQRATRPEMRASEMHRLDATAHAYRARVADVVERYSARVRLWPLAVIACTAPAYRFRVQLLRRNAKSEVTFSWNALNRALEPRCCDGCARPTRVVDLCDDHVHYLCDGCFLPCHTCGRRYCRACHRRCPRKHG